MATTATPSPVTENCKALLDACPDFIWVLTGQHQWVFMNREAREFVGSPKASMWSSSVHQEDLGKLIAALAQAWNGEAVATCELRVRTSHGVWRTIAHRFRRHTETGRMIGVGHDVTELRNTEKQLLERQRYQAALAMAGQTVNSSIDPAVRMSNLEEIAAEAIDIPELRLWPLSQPDDISSLCELGHYKPGDSLEAVRKYLQAPGTLDLLKDGRAAQWQGENNERMVMVPLKHQGQCAALTTMRLPAGRSLARSEMDFLRGICGLLPALKAKPGDKKPEDSDGADS